ncbi:exported hypothetical protein [Candidatus Nitrospira nitrosa]|uniref:Carboxypeptidase regulatory-like domain-containing protein n=1 Tax=Candidatus Nitrospira nitrosa TaxID=1742972 RepID=A0A0S4L5A7_9BACT|nr:exported hypothetical protein [Candidatus Nitrospira nitrosa]
MIRRHCDFRCWLACFLLISCSLVDSAEAAVPSPPNPSTFNEKELFAYKAKGHGSAAGQVFLRTVSGKAVTQAGASIVLIPITSYTRAWFDKQVRESTCSSKGGASSETRATQTSTVDCFRGVMDQLLTDKRLLPYLRVTRANPTGHFWFTKVPAGRYYVVSLLEGSGGAHQDERAVGIAWLTLELDADEKATNLVVTDCKSSLC